MRADYDPILMGNDDMCNCNGVLGAGCIEGEGDCDTDDQCVQVTSHVIYCRITWIITCSEGLRCGDNNCRELVTMMYQGPGKQHMDGEAIRDKEYKVTDSFCYLVCRILKRGGRDFWWGWWLLLWSKQWQCHPWSIRNIQSSEIFQFFYIYLCEIKNVVSWLSQGLPVSLDNALLRKFY